MIGDFLRYKQDFPRTHLQGKIVKVCGIRGRVDVITINDGNFHESEHPNWLEPIPITPEILEKNFQEFLPGINLMYQLKGPYCATNEDGQWVFGLVKVDGENSARYPLVKISFVHQLQHALRLCGIEKEIIV